MSRKGIGLILAGLAAYGYYKFSKMSPGQKKAMKEKAKKFVDDSLGNAGKLFGRKNNAAMARNRYGQP